MNNSYDVNVDEKIGLSTSDKKDAKNLAEER